VLAAIKKIKIARKWWVELSLNIKKTNTGIRINRKPVSKLARLPSIAPP
jgi:hypothetical protein